MVKLRNKVLGPPNNVNAYKDPGSMRRLRNVKIVATLGPVSSDEKTIRALFEAGADVFRLNMSHGTHDDMAARHAIIRKSKQIWVAPSVFWPTCRGLNCV